MASDVVEVQGNEDSSDQHKLQIEAAKELSTISSADNTSIINYFKSDSAGLHAIDTPSDASSTNSKFISTIDESLKNNPNIEHSKVVGDPVIEDELSAKIQEQLALELEARLRLSNFGDPVTMAADRLRSIAGSDLPERFEDDLEEFTAFNKRQRIGNEKAAEMGLKDESGADLAFAYNDDQQIADALNTAADAYEKRQRGDVIGSAQSMNDSTFKDAWREGLQMCLNPIREDYQGQMGTCTYNTELTAGWLNNCDKLMSTYCDLLTTGEHEGESGGVASVTAWQLNQDYVSGQNHANFLMNAAMANYTHGVELRNSWNGNPLEWGDDALAWMTDGESVSTINGVYHDVVPGHSMLGVNIVHADGSMTHERINHWLAPWQNWGEAYEGTKFRYGNIDNEELEKV